MAGIEAGTIGGGRADRPIGILAEEIGILVLIVGFIGGIREDRFFFENGIGLEFGLKEGLEFERGSLQELKRVLDLRRDGGGLAEAGLEGEGHGDN